MARAERAYAVDPGAVHVGVTKWKNQTPRWGREFSPGDFLVMLHSISRYAGTRPNVVIVEGYTLLSPKSRIGAAKDAVATIELIGQIKGICFVHGVPVVMQSPAVRAIAMQGKRWRDLVYDDKAVSIRNGHIRSALAHGAYYYWIGKGRTHDGG